MNYIKHLTGFFNKIHNETTLNPTHISLYLAIFQCWNVNRFRNPTAISREEIMKASKINSKATYHKCMKELELLEFMQYNPTFNPHSSSTVTMVNFAEEIKSAAKIQQPTHSINEPLKNLTESKNEQLIEQVNEQLYIYNKKQTVENISNNTKIDIEKISENEPVQNLNPVINPPEQETAEPNLISSKTPPSLEMVQQYFSLKESSSIEANKFFNYYSSIGWLIGGKTKMKDWKAAARNWMLNTNKFAANTPKSEYNSQPKPMHLHTPIQKNYDEPL